MRQTCLRLLLLVLVLMLLLMLLMLVLLVLLVLLRATPPRRPSRQAAKTAGQDLPPTTQQPRQTALLRRSPSEALPTARGFETLQEQSHFPAAARAQR